MTRMNPEIKVRWTTWLRENPDRQAIGRLRRDDKFCCLGVLCELAVADEIIGPSWIQPSWISSEEFRYFYGGESGHSSTELPDAVISWANLNSSDPVVESPHGKRSLAWLNDEGYTFPQIADLIDEQL